MPKKEKKKHSLKSKDKSKTIILSDDLDWLEDFAKMSPENQEKVYRSSKDYFKGLYNLKDKLNHLPSDLWPI